jgi:hypothetical protein
VVPYNSPSTVPIRGCIGGQLASPSLRGPGGRNERRLLLEAHYFLSGDRNNSYSNKMTAQGPKKANLLESMGKTSDKAD